MNRSLFSPSPFFPSRSYIHSEGKEVMNMNPSQRSRITFLFVTGQNELGENLTVTKTLHNVKGTAADEELTQIVSALSTLQKHPLADVTRTNSYSLV